MKYTLEELQELTINGLYSRKQYLHKDIDELLKEVEALKRYDADIEKVLAEKVSINTHNIVEIIKSYPWRGCPSEIIISVNAVADNDENQIINDIAFIRVKYSDRTMLYDILKDIQKQYGFVKIVCKTMNLVNKICDEFTVVTKL